MGRATFVASKTAEPGAAEAELRELLMETKGVTRWTVEATGKVTIEYDEEVISAANIEEALDGLGYAIYPISERPGAEWRGP